MTTHLFDLTGKTALVTGAAQGLGLAMATAGQAGRQVLNDIQETRLCGAARLTEAGHTVRTAPFDVSDSPRCRFTCGRSSASSGRLTSW
jgi:gluconate 5-dehydrogenase